MSMSTKTRNPRARAAVAAAIALALAGGLAALVKFAAVPAAQYGKAQSLRDKGDVAGAYELLDRLGDYRDAQERKQRLQAEVIKSRPAQSMDVGGDSWLVLEVRDGKALLLLEEALEPRPYNEALVGTTWETCTLRAYLNGAFLDSIDQAQRARIVKTTVCNQTGGDTEDYVFLLSLAQAKLYFPDDAARVARNGKGAAAWWWLRSPGMDPMLAATVGSDGAIGYAGSGVNYSSRGVRPAMWVTMA